MHGHSGRQQPGIAPPSAYALFSGTHLGERRSDRRLSLRARETGPVAELLRVREIDNHLPSPFPCVPPSSHP
jgi:hypothetical protein